MLYDFSVDGVKASAKGIYLQKQPILSPLVPRYITKVVPRYGTYHIFDGYEEQTLTIEAYTIDEYTESTAIYLAYNWLGCVNGGVNVWANPQTRHTIQLFTDDVLYGTYSGVLTSGGGFDIRGGVLNPFTITYSVRYGVN